MTNKYIALPFPDYQEYMEEEWFKKETYYDCNRDVYLIPIDRVHIIKRIRKDMKSYTDIEQSKKLAEILPIESADMHYVLTDSDQETYSPGLEKYYGVLPSIPCWSLAALLSVLPKIHKLKPILDLEENSIQYSGIDFYIVADNPVDVCYKMILKLHELNLF